MELSWSQNERNGAEPKERFKTYFHARSL